MTNTEDQSSEFGAQSEGASSEASAANEPSAEEMRQEFDKALGDLRSELAQLQIEEARNRVRNWIRNNPLLAVLLAAGAGVLSGRLLAKALKPAPPSTLSERARRQVEALRKRAERTASEAGQDVSERVARARKEAGRIGRQAGETLAHRAQDWGEVASERAASLRKRAAKELSDAARSATEQAEEASKQVQSSAKDLSKDLSARAASTSNNWWKEAGANLAKTALITWAAKKLGSWVRQKS